MCSQAKNHEIKVAVGIRPLDCKYTFLSLSQNADAIDYLYGGGGGGGRPVKRRVREENGLIIIANIIYIMSINMLADFHHLLLC